MAKARRHESQRNADRRNGRLPERVPFARMSILQIATADRAIQRKKAHDRMAEVDNWYEIYGYVPSGVYSEIGYQLSKHLLTRYYAYPQGLSSDKNYVTPSPSKLTPEPGHHPAEWSWAFTEYDDATKKQTKHAVTLNDWYEIELFDEFNIHGVVETSPDGKWFRL
jgi:hypothetical protein